MNGMALTVAAQLLESSDWAFTTKIPSKQITVWGSPNADHSGDAVVNWHIDFDVREWGVKELSVFVDKFTLHGTKSTWNDYGPDTEEPFDIEWDGAAGPPPGNRDEPDEDLALAMAQPNWKVKITRANNESSSVTIAPHSVDIDVARQSIEITF